ncbi:MAG TPA: hypothetical protein VK030_05715 [Actinomycetales bacterium]|nr:hypothetical protein [Actinomycetales bacterium]
MFSYLLHGQETEGEVEEIESDGSADTDDVPADPVKTAPKITG